MPFTVAIVPLAPSVDMFGDPELSSAYAVSGHLLLSLSSSIPFFDKPRPLRLLLTSLELNFEGKAETVSGYTGYHATRLFSASKQLLPLSASSDVPQPLELSNDGHEDSGKPCTWQVVFNLPIPGWLPASTIYGEEDLSSVAYSLFARATFSHLDDEPSNHVALSSSSSLLKPWKWATMCASSFRLRSKSLSTKPIPIVINRFATPSPTSSAFPPAYYSVRLLSASAIEDPTIIPSSILCNLQVVASTPSRISTHDKTVPISFRIRSTNPQNITSRIRVTSFSLDLEQQEKYASLPSSSYASTYPLPPDAEQPPKKPLVDPHPLEMLYGLGLVCPGDVLSSQNGLFVRNWSIVKPDQSVNFSLRNPGQGEDSASSSDGLELQADGWHKISLDMPITPASLASSSAATFFDDDDVCTTGALYHPRNPRSSTEEKKPSDLMSKKPRKVLRPSFESPYYRVQHEMGVLITCTYQPEPAADGTPAKELSSDLKFAIPLQFVCLPPSLDLDSCPVSPVSSEASLVSDESSSLASASSSRTSTPPPAHASASTSQLPAGAAYPRTHPLGSNALPAYSQLFHSNGDWRDDVFAGLPAYSKTDDAEALPLMAGL